MSDLINLDALASALAERLKQAPEPLVYTIDELAHRLRLGESTIRQMVKDREFRVVRRGTRVLIPRSEVLKWLEKEAG